MIINVYDGQIPKELISKIREFDSEGISGYLNDPFTFTTGIVSMKDKVIAAGIIRVVNELKICFRQDISNINKAMALKLLMKESNKNMQCNEAVAIITQGGNHYVDILKNHFRFTEDSGVFLRLEREV